MLAHSVHKLKNWKVVSIFFFLIILTFFLYMIDLTDYGPTWDEFFHIPNGQRYFDFLKTGNLIDIFSNPNSGWFPPVATTIGYLFVDNSYIKQVYPQQSDRFHIAAVVFASLTVGMVFLIVYTLSQNIYISLFGGLLLFFHPQFMTHAHTNVRDMGLVMFYTATIFTLLKSMEKASTFWIVASGVLAALATDSKQNGIFLVIIAFFWLALHIRTLKLKRFMLGFSLFIGVFLLSCFIFWPYLWADTINHLSQVWKFLTTPSIIAGNLTFYDRIYTSMVDIPIYYPWVMLFLLTPPLVGFLAIIGMGISCVSFWQKDKKTALIFLWILIPLSRFLFPKSSISYDQIRHFLEVLPSLAVFASLAIWASYQKFHKISYQRWVIVAIAITAVLYTWYISFIYQPFGTAYFNIFAGSGKYVTHAFDVEYWGNVYREAVEYLNMTHGKYAIYYNPGLGSHLLQEDGLQGTLTEDLYRPFDYVIFMNKQNWIRDGGRHYIRWLLATKKPIFTIEREGKILFYQFLPYKEEYK